MITFKISIHGECHINTYQGRGVGGVGGELRGEGGGGRWGRKGSSFCGTPAEKLKNLQPVACKVMILRLRHHQDSQVAFYIDTKL